MQTINTNEIPASVVGLGLMGCSITACLLMAGHPVIALAPIEADMQHAEGRIMHHLQKSLQEGLTNKKPAEFAKQLLITMDYAALKDCKLVIECTIENVEIKKNVYGKIEAVVSNDAIITSNTSAIPISILQSYTKHQDRFLGLHWAEPSHTTRFLEIICGDKSDVKKGEFLYELSNKWGKEATLVRKDIRGFIQTD